MKGKDIVKALECCVLQNCNECPYDDTNCSSILKDVLDFINRLKVERNKYKFKAQCQKGELARLNKQVVEQREEIEMYRLGLADVTVKLFAMCKKIDQMHAELKIVTEQCPKGKE